MIMTEDLMCLLYDEACINGTEEKQLATLAAKNKMSVEKVLAILERNGCDVERVMGKRGRPPKNKPVETLKEEKKVEIVEEKEEVQATEISGYGIVKEKPSAVEVPEVVRNLIKQKIELNNKMMEGFKEKITVIEVEQKELQDFLNTCE